VKSVSDTSASFHLEVIGCVQPFKDRIGRRMNLAVIDLYPLADARGSVL
jgi:hypothetical protein